MVAPLMIAGALTGLAGSAIGAIGSSQNKNTFRASNPYGRYQTQEAMDQDFSYGHAGGAGVQQFAGNLGERGELWDAYGQDYMDAAGGEYGGARVNENAELVDRYNQGYGEQQGATQLAREAAMGLAPSEAAVQMQQGLDQATAEQAGVSGGARGAAALSMAQANEGGNVSRMQQQTYMDASKLRAQEMAAARGLYGTLSGSQATSALNRLGEGNRYGQRSLEMDDARRQQLGSLGIQAGQLGSVYTGQQRDVYGQGADMGLRRQQIASGVHTSADNMNANLNEAQAGRIEDRWKGLARAGGSLGGGMMSSGGAPAAPGGK